MTESVNALRDRLHAREYSLKSLRKKVQDAKEAVARPAVKSTISDIQKRYLSAVAELETKEKELPKPSLRPMSAPVSSLASRWNEGISGKEVQKTRVDVRGDVRGTQQNFKARDVPNVSTVDAPKAKTPIDPGPAELIVEDEDAGLPSWAVNQKKKVIKKENARSSVRDVDVRELQGSVLESGARDGSEIRGEAVQAKGNVKAALAMWGKTAEEDALLLKKKKEEEEGRRAEEERLRKEKVAEEHNRAIKAAAVKFAKMQLADMPREEPQEEIELIAYLERKITLVEKDIAAAEAELSYLESS